MPSFACDTATAFINFSATLLLVLVNRRLATSGFGFGTSDAPRFAWAELAGCSVSLGGRAAATTLCSLQLLATAGSLWLATALRLLAWPPQRPTWPDVLKAATIAGCSIISLHLSLRFVSVKVFQVTKLLLIPCACSLTTELDEPRAAAAASTSIAAVAAGMAIIAAHVELTATAAALPVALAVPSNRMACRLQRRYQQSPHQLMLYTAHVQGLLLLTVAAHVDSCMGLPWVGAFVWSWPVLRLLLLSLLVVVVATGSQLLCASRLPAAAVQVLGHSKMAAVLLLRWWAGGDQLTAGLCCGVALVTLGMVMMSSGGGGVSSMPAALAAAEPLQPISTVVKRRRRRHGGDVVFGDDKELIKAAY